METKFLLVPHFIANVLARNNQPLKSFLNFDELRKYVSLNDIAQVLVLQNAWDLLIGRQKIDQNGTTLDTSGILVEAWNKTATGANVNFMNDATLTVLVETGKSKKELEERLFDTSALDANQYPNAFEIVDLGIATNGVVIYPGYFANPSVALQEELISSIVKMMYIYHPLDEIAHTTFFEAFVESLN